MENKQKIVEPIEFLNKFIEGLTSKEGMYFDEQQRSIRVDSFAIKLNESTSTIEMGMYFDGEFEPHSDIVLKLIDYGELVDLTKPKMREYPHLRQFLYYADIEFKSYLLNSEKSRRELDKYLESINERIGEIKLM